MQYTFSTLNRSVGLYILSCCSVLYYNIYAVSYYNSDYIIILYHDHDVMSLVSILYVHNIHLYI